MADDADITGWHEIALAAAREAGVILVSPSTPFDVLSSQGKDLKSAADLAAERAIITRLEQTGIPIIAEETRADRNLLSSERVWVVDPLDGTLNYTRHFPLYCVSIGLWDSGKPLLGCVFDPLRNQMFSGIVGRGAWCNEQPLSVSRVSDFGQAVLCTGFPSSRSFETETLNRFVAEVKRFKKLRLLGSAALSLAYVAAGYADCYCEEGIWLWDVAAGLAIVEAAGGSIKWSAWDAQLKATVIAANSQLSFDLPSGTS
jgi:myo-inositol-1(or 4)-monophosphatase